MTISSVPQVSLGPNGFIIPQQSAILAGEEADINSAFGGVVNFNPGTSASQLAATNTAVIGNTFELLMALFNGIDPAYASGRMQDALGRIYRMTRIQGVATVSEVTCSGLAGVNIPVGVQIKALDGNLYSCTQAGTIPLSGSIVLAFACSIQGPIACPAQTFQPYQTIPGWDSSASIADAPLGRNVETRAAFELRRQGSVAANANGMLQAIRGAVLAVPNVLDVYTSENDNKYPQSIGPEVVATGSISGTVLTVSAATSGTIELGQSINVVISGIAGVTLPTGITILSLGTGTGGIGTYNLSASATVPSNTLLGFDGVVINPNSVYIAVAGGLASDVAQAIFSKKMPGCGYTGNTTQVAYDTSAPYVAPGMPYNVTYEIPSNIDVYFTVTILNNIGVPSNAATLIQNAILAAFNGTDGSPLARIGSTVQASRYVPGITSLGAWAQLEPIGIATSLTTPSAMVAGSISGTTLTVTAITSGTLASGLLLSGIGVSNGTFILSQSSGTPGGIGTYAISIGQTVGSETINAISVTSPSFSMSIDQMPVTSAANINVVLA